MTIDTVLTVLTVGAVVTYHGGLASEPRAGYVSGIVGGRYTLRVRNEQLGVWQTLRRVRRESFSVRDDEVPR